MTNRNYPRPFLKWAGGKTQLLPELMKRVPESYNRYFEPFLGGGALFFALQPRRAFLSDINFELVNAYQVVKEDTQKLVSSLKKHVYDHDYYYSLRDADRTYSYNRWGKVRRASRFIYLNKTGYNGLYRVNSKGQNNVPFGKYKNPSFYDENNLLACSCSLQTTRLQVVSFEKILKSVKEDDFVYLDPPYMPISKTASFTNYTKIGFGEKEQLELFQFCCSLDAKRIKFMQSNSHTPFIKKLYKQFSIESIRASRSINSNSSKRGSVKEVIITNFS